MYGHYAGTPHKISIPVPNWNFVFACVDLAIHCIERGRSSLGGPCIQSKGLREAAEFQRNGKQAPELTKASSVAINDDRTHLQTRTLWFATILAILEVEWLYHSQLRATVGSKTNAGSVAVSRYYHRCKCMAIMLNSPQNLHSVPNWNFVFACVDLAIHCIGSGRFLLGRPVYPEQRLERGGRVSEKWQTSSRAHQSKLSCYR